MKRTFHYKAEDTELKIDLVLKVETNFRGFRLFEEESKEKFNKLQDDIFGFLFERFHSSVIKQIKK